MKRFLKKTISVLMIVVMCLTMAPMQGFVGLDISSLFAREVKAAYAPSSGETYWAMNHDEALGFIAFIYDTGKVTDDMMNAGNLYTFLTGGFERGSIEELCAKISFLATARTNISQCINNYSAVMNNAYSSLLEYLIEQANGDIDDGLANSTLDSVKDSIKSIILTLGNANETVLENLEYIGSAYSTISSIKGKVEKIKAGINALNYTLSSANKAPYEYIRTYISNFSISDSLSDVDGVAGVIEGFNSVIKMDEGGKLSGAFLFYGNDNKVEQVESYGRYIYYVTKSLETSGIYVDSSGSLKIVQVHCPTDVYVYDSTTNTQLISIINNEITVYDNCVLATVCNSEKLIVLPKGKEYTINIVATDNGTMDYIVTEYLDSGFLREVNYMNVELEKNEQFNSNIPEQIQVSASEYNLKKDNGEEIDFTIDSLPAIEDNIVDVIVAEELFDGFPVEIIDLVADTMFNMKSVVDLSVYDISTDDAVALFSAVAKYYPAEYSLIANSDFTYKIIVSPNLDRIMKIRFYYGDDANLSTYQKRVEDLNAEIDALVAKVEGMDDFEKALYIHDYIVLNSEYDLELLEYMEANNCILPGELRSEKYTEYSILVNGTGVCGSYALAYRAVLNAAGMECLYLSSSQMNHAWNMVKIDGNWYHVDCCWDDPVPDQYGRARRTYFLRSDEEIMELNHYSWTPGQYKAKSEKYSDMPRNYDIKQKYDDGKWYYLEGTTLYSSDKYGDNEIELGSISASSIDYDEGTLYFSKGRYVQTYDVETKETGYVYFLSKADSGDDTSKAYISNIYVDGENISYYKSVYDSEAGETKTFYDEYFLQKDKLSKITGISLNYEELTLDLLEETSLIAKIEGIGSASGLDIVWVSSDETIVSVDENGKIKGINVGEATIKANISNFSASCVVSIHYSGGIVTGSCGNNASWSLDPTSGILKISGSGTISDFSSTSSVPWNSLKNYIKHVIIEYGITSIGKYSFYGHTNLESIEIPDSITKIGDSAFCKCSNLQDVEIPNSVTTIEDFAFAYCESINSILIPDKITKIPNWLFYYCLNLEHIDITSNITSIGREAFRGCINLKNIIIPDKVTTIGQSVFDSCISLTSVILPEGITTIPYEAFYGCLSLENITIPDSVTVIGGHAFWNCSSLKKVSIPQNVTSIENLVFHNCFGLEKISVSENNEYYFSDISGVLYDKKENTLLQYPIGNKEKSYIILDGTTVIARRAFWNCSNIKNITIPDSISDIEYGAFYECSNLTHVAYKISEDKIDNINIVQSNDYLINAPHIHYGFSHDTDIIHIEESNASCTNEGFSAYDYCINCQYCFDGETIPATGHSYALSETVTGSCTTATIYTYTCTSCGDTYTKEGKIEDGHIYEKTVIAPTCDEKGYTKEVCTVCGETTLSDFTSPKGHEFIINKSADYCSAHGTLEYSCKNCDYSESIVYDAADLVTETVTVEPTCTKSGTKAEICTLCGATVSVEILNPLSHEYSDEYTVDVEATCTTAGRKSQHCIRCDAKRAVTTIKATGHQSTSIINKAEATCTGNGYTGDTYCNDCKTVIATGERTSKLPHNYNSVVTEPTCTSKGFTTHTCTACGDSYTDTETAMISHSYSSVVTPVTCTLNGYTTHTCIVCSHSYTSDTVPAIGHNYNDNGICVGCGKNRTENCSHMCHNSGFMGIIWKILRFFFKLFRIQPVCSCGVAHY